MELHDNHIRIYRSILQVLQSLSRDNHGIFISLVLFETWLCCVSNLQFFSPWEPALLILPGSQGLFRTSIFSSVSKAQDTCQKETKEEVHPFRPQRTKSPPPRKQGQSDTAEKLQFVWTSSVWTLSTLSCLQVNLSWGICRGSSCFCI